MTGTMSSTTEVPPPEGNAPEYTRQKLADNLCFAVLAIKEANEAVIRLRKLTLAQRSLLIRCQDILGKHITSLKPGDEPAWELWKEINAQLTQISPLDFFQSELPYDPERRP
jgi:hypothetical protein